MAARHHINYGKMRLWGSAAWVAMSLLGGFLWPLFGLWLMFPLASLIFIVTMLPARMLGHDAATTKVARQPLRLTSGSGRFWILLACAVIISLALVMARTFSAIYIDRLSGQTLVGVYAAVAAAIEIPAMLLTERVMRRIGGPFTLALSCLLLVGAYLGLAVIPRPELLLFAALLEGVGYGFFITAIVRLVAGWSPHGQVATYQGLLNAGSSGLAPLIAGLLGGAIFDTSGPQAVFVASAGAAVVGMLVLATAQMLGLFTHDLVIRD
jgi:MFS family permease